MQSQTNLEGIKQTVRSFLALEPKPTEYSPMIIKHPFTDSGIVPVSSGNGYIIADITSDKECLKQWRDKLCERIDNATDTRYIYSMITKSYLFAFLKFAMPYMSRVDFSKYLADAWIRCEAPNADPNFTTNELVNLFHQSNPSELMTADEYNAYIDLPDTLIVYRGVPANHFSTVKSLSWTLDKEKAEWFAHRWGEDGTVYQAQIMKSDTFALFLARGESEVIVNPRCLMNITTAEDIYTETINDMKGLTL